MAHHLYQPYLWLHMLHAPCCCCCCMLIQHSGLLLQLPHCNVFMPEDSALVSASGNAAPEWAGATCTCLPNGIHSRAVVQFMTMANPKPF